MTESTSEQESEWATLSAHWACKLMRKRCGKWEKNTVKKREITLQFPMTDNHWKWSKTSKSNSIEMGITMTTNNSKWLRTLLVITKQQLRKFVQIKLLANLFCLLIFILKSTYALNLCWNMQREREQVLLLVCKLWKTHFRLFLNHSCIFIKTCNVWYGNQLR